MKYIDILLALLWAALLGAYLFLDWQPSKITIACAMFMTILHFSYMAAERHLDERYR